MGLEIERKFLVDKTKWERAEKGEGKVIRQGYILANKEKAVRVRIMNQDAFITVKGSVSETTRLEFEYKIPVVDAAEMLNKLSENEISKTRYCILVDHKTWEVDVFETKNKGLIVAEIELSSEAEKFIKPEWVAEEVTHDERYLNTNLAEKPFSNW